jgi:hypothetical protein
MTRAALVAGVIAAAASLPLSAALGAPQETTARSTFVVRGVVVQYIPPAGSIVGSLSIRVVNVGVRGRALLGELITVAVEPGDASKPLRKKSLYTLTLSAASPASVLKGAADVRAIVPSAPAPPAATGPTAGTTLPGNPDAPAKSDSPAGDDGGGSGNRGASQSSDHGAGQGGDHGSGQGSDHGSGSQGHGGGGSNGHK